jgi:hypothetical protein
LDTNIVVLICEVSIRKSSTVLSILVDGELIAQRELDFPISIGDVTKMSAGSLGAALAGVNQGGIFLLGEVGINLGTLSHHAQQLLVENVRTRYGFQ